MDFVLDLLRLLAAIAIALAAGKLISKLKLPAILGWLIAGMIMGPHAVGLLSQELLDSIWFSTAESILECTVGLMIGTELIWKQMKKAGPQILVTTITESIGTFLVVSLVFGVIFWITDVPIYLAFMFGGIALATAPAPSLSIVSELKTSGPVTKTLIPMAALDDLVGAAEHLIASAGLLTEVHFAPLFTDLGNGQAIQHCAHVLGLQPPHDPLDEDLIDYQEGIAVHQVLGGIV